MKELNSKYRRFNITGHALELTFSCCGNHYPVRKELKATLTEWEWSNARNWLLDEPGPLEINKDKFPDV